MVLVITWANCWASAAFRRKIRDPPASVVAWSNSRINFSITVIWSTGADTMSRFVPASATMRVGAVVSGVASLRPDRACVCPTAASTVLATSSARAFWSTKMRRSPAVTPSSSAPSSTSSFSMTPSARASMSGAPMRNTVLLRSSKLAATPPSCAGAGTICPVFGLRMNRCQVVPRLPRSPRLSPPPPVPLNRFVTSDATVRADANFSAYVFSCRSTISPTSSSCRRARTRSIVLTRSVITIPFPLASGETIPYVEIIRCTAAVAAVASIYFSGSTTVTTSPGRTPSVLSSPCRIFSEYRERSFTGTTWRNRPFSISMNPCIPSSRFSVSKASAYV